MATGYTHKTMEGTDTLGEMLANMARGMGAYIHQRDEPPSTGLTKRTEASYAQESYEKYLREHEDLCTWDAQRILDEYAEAEAEYEKARADYFAKNKLVRERYETRIAEVEAIDWPEDTEDTDGFWKGYREFVMSQLKDSLEFDCPENSSLYADSFAELHPDANEWYVSRVQNSRRVLNNSKEYLDKQNQRVAQQNAIHEQLMRLLAEL